MKRGDVVIVAVPGDCGKPRPAVVAQTDALNTTLDSVVICPLTSSASDAPLARVRVRPSSANGLERPSDVMAEKVTIVHRRGIGPRIGVMDDATMLAVNRALAFVLAMD